MEKVLGKEFLEFLPGANFLLNTAGVPYLSGWHLLIFVIICLCTQGGVVVLPILMCLP